MRDKKASGETGPPPLAAFSPNRKPATEYEKEQEALRTNHARLKADRLAREAAKLKEQKSTT